MLKNKFGLVVSFALAGSVLLSGCGDEETPLDEGEEEATGHSGSVSVMASSTADVYSPLDSANSDDY